MFGFNYNIIYQGSHSQVYEMHNRMGGAHFFLHLHWVSGATLVSCLKNPKLNNKYPPCLVGTYTDNYVDSQISTGLAVMDYPYVQVFKKQHWTLYVHVHPCSICTLAHTPCVRMYYYIHNLHVD